MTQVDFALFLAAWNGQQRLGTPILHRRMARWLERAWNAGDTRLLMMAFRSSGKSTICGIFAAWLLYKNPDLRILVLAADGPLAKKMVRNVRKIIEQHVLTLHLRPQKADQWASDRFTVQRTLELRDPSMLARGISANITGSRADVVICDDVEVPGTCDSIEKRSNLRETLGEMNYVLVPGGMILYLGTPHTYYSIYAATPREEIGEDRVFLDEFKRFILPVLNARGESAWPERFSIEDIARLRVSAGPNKFTSQMMLRPVNIAQGRLDADALQFYSGGIAYMKELDRLEIANRPMVSAHAWWDPAFGTEKGDHSVVAVVFMDEAGSYYLHRLEYIRIDSFNPENEAAQQCRKVAFIAQLLRLPSITIESNGIGKLLPGILRNVLQDMSVPCSVQEVSSSRAKDERILEAFDAILAAKLLHVHESVKQTPFVHEMREWRPGKNKGHDDGLDAVAGALSLAPIRIRRFGGQRGNHTWMRGVRMHKARTDYKL